MWLRILLAAVIGGVLVFFMGAFNHAGLHLQDRTILNMPQSDAFSEYLKSRDLKHGLYDFPEMPKAAEEGDKSAMEAYNERYGEGPSGMLLIVHRGKMVLGEMLGKELVTNFIAALMAAWIISLVGPDVGFLRRWLAVLVMGLMGWVTLAASYGIWYRFPHDFLHDELLCAFLEWSVAGLAIAAIVRRPPAAVPASKT